MSLGASFTSSQQAVKNLKRKNDTAQEYLGYGSRKKNANYTKPRRIRLNYDQIRKIKTYEEDTA